MILSKSPNWIDAVFNHCSFGFLHSPKATTTVNGFCDFARPFGFQESYAGTSGIEIEILWGREMGENDFRFKKLKKAK